MRTVLLNQTPVAINSIFGIGRNYVAHAAELGNVAETNEPLVFGKPNSALHREDEGDIILPTWSNDVHHECELVILIGSGGQNILLDDAYLHIAGLGIGIDLTARDVQTQLKNKGYPWLKAKGFAHSAAVSSFISVPIERFQSPFSFSLTVNGQTRQVGNTNNMIFNIPFMISYLSKIYGLSEGDLIFTGTPEGVAKMQAGDCLNLALDGLVNAQFRVAL